MLTFVSSNQEKIHFAKIGLEEYRIACAYTSLELQEIQSDSIEEIVIHKAKDAFSKIQSPVIVSDHGWSIKTLNGFPGSYMKYMNEWLSAQDLLRLMDGKSDRRVLFLEYICYYEGGECKVFFEHVAGDVLLVSEGEGLPGQQVFSLTGDNHSIAYHLNRHEEPRGEKKRKVWSDFAKWYLSK